MGRLTAAPSRLDRIAPRVGFVPRDEHGHSKAEEPWRAWFNLKRWKLLRLRVFVRDLYTCQRRECGRIEPDTSQLVGDHIQPHRGDPDLFWDEDNVQTLCKPCHDRLKQAEEHRARVGPTEAEGEGG